MSENITFSLDLSIYFNVYNFHNKYSFYKYAKEYFFCTRVVITANQDVYDFYKAVWCRILSQWDFTVGGAAEHNIK